MITDEAGADDRQYANPRQCANPRCVRGKVKIAEEEMAELLKAEEGTGRAVEFEFGPRVVRVSCPICASEIERSHHD